MSVFCFLVEIFLKLLSAQALMVWVLFYVLNVLKRT